MAKKPVAKKTNAEKIARQAGKVAAKAERSATEAVERARALSAYLAEFFGRPIGAVVHAGQETIGSLSSGVSHLLSSDTGESPSTPGEDVRGVLEERWRAVVHELGLPTRDEYEALKARLAELESTAGKRRTPPQRPGGKVAPKPVAKSAAKPAPKPAAKTASKVAASPAAPSTAPAVGKPAPKSVRKRQSKTPDRPVAGGSIANPPARPLRRTGSGN